MSNLDDIMHKLSAIEADIASIHEALGMLLEAFQAPPTAPVAAKPPIATYAQMYGQVETPKEEVRPLALAPPPPAAPSRWWRWLLKEDAS